VFFVLSLRVKAGVEAESCVVHVIIIIIIIINDNL